VSGLEVAVTLRLFQKGVHRVRANLEGTADANQRRLLG
jgi:hypothetical protein